MLYRDSEGASLKGWCLLRRSIKAPAGWLITVQTRLHHVGGAGRGRCAFYRQGARTITNLS